MEVIKKSVHDLVSDPNNARTHNIKNIEAIKGSLLKFGQQKPIVVNKDGVVIAGNGTLQSARELGWEQIDCVVTELNEMNQAAFGLADNKTAELADWDLEQLGSTLDSLAKVDFDVSEIGFDIDGVPSLNENEEDEIKKNELNEEAEKLLNQEFKDQASYFLKAIELLIENDLGTFDINIPYARFKFLKSLYYGDEYPRHCSLAFHKQQIYTKGDSNSFIEGLKKIENEEIKAKNLRFLTNDNIMKSLRCGLPFSGSRIPLDFPASLAKTLINEFMGNEGKILDPCHGWGGRCVGFLLSDASEYLGVDASTEQSKGLHKIKENFLPFVEDKKVELLCSPYEDCEIKKNYYDFALTSPPYFDVEDYLGGEQSHKRYNNYDLWRDGFYYKLISKTFDSLKQGGHFALQVGSQKYPLHNDGKKIAESVGFSFVEVRQKNITRKNKEKDFDIENDEVILILRKPERL